MQTKNYIMGSGHMYLMQRAAASAAALIRAALFTEHAEIYH